MRVAVRKVDGVETADVSLERGVVDVRLRPGNQLTLARLRQLIKHNGFNPGDATVSVNGQLAQSETSPTLAVSGTDIILLLTSDPSHAAAFSEVAARLKARSLEPVTIEGVVNQNPGRQHDQLVVRALRGVSR